MFTYNCCWSYLVFGWSKLKFFSQTLLHSDDVFRVVVSELPGKPRPPDIDASAETEIWQRSRYFRWRNLDRHKANVGRRSDKTAGRKSDYQVCWSVCVLLLYHLKNYTETYIHPFFIRTSKFVRIQMLFWGSNVIKMFLFLTAFK